MSHRVVLTNAKGSASDILAEFIVYTVLSQLHQHKHNVKMACDLVVGLVGFGTIGLACARIVKETVGSRVIASKRDVLKMSREEREFVDEVYDSTQLDSLLRKSDIVINTLPSTDETKALFDFNKFALMKPNSLFVNIGRGSTVVEVTFLALNFYIG